MVDVAGHGAPPGVYEGSVAEIAIGPNNGGALMRPDAGFHFVNGRLVIEVGVAAAMTAYSDRIWPEIVVTTAEAPTGTRPTGGTRPGSSGASRLSRAVYPRLVSPSVEPTTPRRSRRGWMRVPPQGRPFAEGGAPTTAARDSAWRRCAATQSDELCRDRFRLVLEKDALSLFVNGVRYMEHRGLPAASHLPRELVDSTVYVYFASWAYLVEPTVARFHWGRVAINP
jgi:hypothetical protein